MRIPWLQRGRIPRAFGAVTLVLAAGLIGACAETDSGSDARQTNSGATSNAPQGNQMRAPNFRLATMDGGEVELNELRGKVVLVDFWATWCGPCRMEIPHLTELYDRYQDKGFELVGISLDQQGPAVVKPFIEEFKINYPIVMGDEDIANQYGGVRSIPTAFLIDREGNVVKKYVGYKPLETFVADIEPLI